MAVAAKVKNNNEKNYFFLKTFTVKTGKAMDADLTDQLVACWMNGGPLR